MNVNIGRRLNYKDLFDDDPLLFSDYFQGMSKKNIMEAIPTLINAAYPKSELHLPEDLVKMWFSPPNDTIKKSILAKLSPGVGIANIISSLKFVEYVMEHDFDKTQTISQAQFEINLFKAYILLNDEQDKIEDAVRLNLPPEDKEHYDERLLAIMLRTSFHDSDLMNYEIWDVLVPQILKSFEFFTYMENRPELAPHLAYFLQKFGCATWKDWLTHSLSVALPPLTVNNGSYYDYIVPIDADYKKNCQFLDTFCLNDEKHTLSDFITQRSYPLMKVEEGKYRVINKLFLIEKMFKSIQFLFSLQINEKLPEAERLKDFRADHCDKFSEQTLLYKVVKNSFPKRWIHIPGEAFKAKGYTAEPDYYLRNKNKIFLFESKDVVLKGKEKQSRDYPTLSHALKEKFYKIEMADGTVDKKAIHQLIENIKRILSHYYKKCDIDYDPKLIRIYPILITHDRQFDALGVNKLISDWFQNEIEQIKGDYNISNVQPLTVVNIDTLLIHQEVFKNRGKLQFEKLIEDYHALVNFQPQKGMSLAKMTQKKTNSFQSFSDFAGNEIKKLKLMKQPFNLNESVKQLLK